MKALGLALALAIATAGCVQLPAVVDDVANIAKIVIADVERGGMTPAQVIADVLSQTGSTDVALVISIVEGLLADGKTPQGDVPKLQAVRAEALAMKAARTAQTGHP